MASIITAPGVQDIEALKLDPNLTNQYVSVDSDMVNNDMANKLKNAISDNYNNVTKRFSRLGGDFKEISKCEKDGFLIWKNYLIIVQSKVNTLKIEKEN